MTTGDGDAFASRAQGRVGTVLRGKYRLDRVLGVGGMAVVYKATHRNEAEFAIKMLHPELSLREDLRIRFLREGKAANSVKHSGVVRVVDDDVAEDGAAFLVMELLEGAAIQTLWERCGHRLPLSAVLSMAEQLLAVLGAAHDKGIVHRDIKPANLFGTPDGTLKVLDFGIARLRDAATGQGTGTGLVLGTAAYMAPEQAFAKASEIDGQTDVWAVGATLFTLLSGQFVHQGENASQLMVRAATERARRVGSVLPDLPAGVMQAIDCALEFEKASRWPCAEAMRSSIEKASVEAFGERPSKAWLEALVAGGDLGVSRPDRPATSMSRPPAIGMTLTAAPPAPTAPRLVGGTTAQPVALQDAAPPVVRSRRRVASRIAIAAGCAVIFVATGLALRATFAKSGGPEPGKGELSSPAILLNPATTATATPTPGAPAIEASGTSKAAAAPAVTLTLPTDDAGMPFAVHPESWPARTPELHGSSRPAGPTQPESRRVSVLAPATLPAPATPHAAAINCDPPTWTDPIGHVHLKPGCQ